VGPKQVRHVERGLAEERAGAGLLERQDRPKHHADRGLRDAPVLLERRLALVRAEEAQRRAEVGQVEQRQLTVVAEPEHEREHRGLRLVEVEDFGE
jgi:hypothetical protein